MGAEFIAESLEDLCDLMCNNYIPKKREQKMSDYENDARREKYLEWKDQQREAMRSACESCEYHNGKCLYWDPEQETFDYEECFRDSGGWE